ALVARQDYSVGQQIETTVGTVIGQASKWKPEVSEYIGIPFAQPPVGDLRWAAPKSMEKASTPIDATVYGDSCAESASRLSAGNSSAPQNIGAAENQMSEDCLYLNLWTKPQAGEKKKAVLIWIYGGGFVVGSAANEVYNGALLAEEQDVIVASMNYRISVLGFPGVGLPEKNLGLLDQRAAIEWLRDNVEKFGGDPKRMTIFGQSAGGYSVDTYSYAYTNDPIVAGLIPQSGTAPATPTPVVVDKNGNTEAKVKTWSDLSVALNCGEVTADDVSKTLACMRGKPLETVMNATEPRGNQQAARAWGPGYDNKTFFPDIAERRESGEFIQVPVLVGNTNNELATSRGILGSDDNKKQNCGSAVAAQYR
ncbi:hypothetical protein LTS18_000753, partial [Coniosporium uncinatum]